MKWVDKNTVVIPAPDGAQPTEHGLLIAWLRMPRQERLVVASFSLKEERVIDGRRYFVVIVTRKV